MSDFISQFYDSALVDELPGFKSATYTPYGGSASTIYIHFTKGYQEVATPDGGVMNAYMITARCQSSDISDVVNRSTLLIDSTTYYVIDINKEFEEGETLLILSENDLT